VEEGYLRAQTKVKNLAQNHSYLLVLEEVRQKTQGPHNLGLRLAVVGMAGLVVVVVEEDLVLSMDPLKHDGHVEASDEAAVGEGVLCQILDIVSFVDLVWGSERVVEE
jgi:hypothetical protein